MVVVGVVLEVRVLHDHHVARGMPEALADGRALARVLGLEDDHVARALAQEIQEQAGAIAGAIIHDDDLLLERHGLDLREDLAERGALVVDGHDD